MWLCHFVIQDQRGALQLACGDRVWRSIHQVIYHMGVKEHLPPLPTFSWQNAALYPHGRKVGKCSFWLALQPQLDILGESVDFDHLSNLFDTTSLLQYQNLINFFICAYDVCACASTHVCEYGCIHITVVCRGPRTASDISFYIFWDSFFAICCCVYQLGCPMSFWDSLTFISFLVVGALEL